MSLASLPEGEYRPPVVPRQSIIETFTPKTVVCFKEGYSVKTFLADLTAGLTVGIIALPLAMALAIASGVGPEKGLYTAIIAGGITALLGGSRVSVAGPTAAFAPLLSVIVLKNGYQGLAIASLMAGVILLLMGVFRLGAMIKFIPYPVTTGFTAGIAITIFTGQVKDFLGLTIKEVPVEFIGKWSAYFHHLNSINWYSTAIAVGGLAIILFFRWFIPKIPGALIAVILAAVAVGVFHLDDSKYGVETIQTKFGTPQVLSGIPDRLPGPNFSLFSFDSLKKAKGLIPQATTIALLAAIESLLCCVVADGMIGRKHKSNCELMAQGVGNIASILFGGIPATGAIARTAANIKSGGKTPLSAFIHALTLLGFMLLFARYAAKVPLAVLASVLMVVAYGMSEKDHFIHLFKAPKSDILVLLTTFSLTVLADLTIAVGVGMVLASLLFMKRMTEVTIVNTVREDLESSDGQDYTIQTDPNIIDLRDIPHGVEVYEINGPFFFGVADRLSDVLRQFEPPPKVFILRMRRVPAIDATGLHALEDLLDRCKRQGTRLLLSGIHAQPIFALVKYGLMEKFGEENLFGNIDEALDFARKQIGAPAKPHPQGAAPEVARERQNP